MMLPYTWKPSKLHGSTVFDNPAQTKRLDELRSDIEARMHEFKQAIELGPEHLTEALARRLDPDSYRWHIIAASTHGAK